MEEAHMVQGGQMTEQQQKSRADALWDELLVLNQKLLDKLNEYRAVTDGELTPGQKARRLVDAFRGHWRARYHADYVPNWPRDTAIMKGLLKTMEPPAVDALVQHYLRDNDVWLQNQRHPIAVLTSRVNQYSLLPPEATRPVGCAHTPPCTSDVAHTRRQMAERKSVNR
jgi:hypothetical protein